MKTAYAGRFGSDEAGKLGLESLIDEGVNVDHASVADDARTQIAFVIVDERSGERTIIWKRDDNARLFARRCYPRSRLLGKDTPHDAARHCGGHCDGPSRARCGTVVSLDIDNMFDGVETLLGLTDIMIASSDLLKRVTGIRDKLSAMTEAASRYGCADRRHHAWDEGSQSTVRRSIHRHSSVCGARRLRRHNRSGRCF